MAGARIVVLGMMSRMPVPGVVWQTLHYLVGLQRLGYEPFYVETHGRAPTMLMTSAEDDGGTLAASFIDRILRPFDLGRQWAFQALHGDGRCFGMSEGSLRRLYRSAALLIDLHGGTAPRPELAETGRLAYLETDPVQLQVELSQGRQSTFDFLEPHSVFFTFAENYGRPDCMLPRCDRFAFHPTRQPVVVDLWRSGRPSSSGEAFTTVGNWRQAWRDVVFEGEAYTWSKHHEFLKYLDLPRRTAQPLELALASCATEDRELLRRRGWRVRDAHELADLHDYRDYIRSSRGEFTVAKDQNVRLRTGWFSDRSATYLAAGRPVITQDTGFASALPTGEGLFGFSTMDEALEALAATAADYARHSRAAAAIAREHFAHDVVLPRLLADAGVDPVRQRSADPSPFPPQMVLTPLSRRPLRLPRPTVTAALRAATVPRTIRGKHASLVVVTHGGVAITRLCLESVLAAGGDFELLVVDNGSTDGMRDYLRRLSRRHQQVRVVLNRENRGFGPACNQGLELASTDRLVLLNNDTMVAPGWLPRLLAHLEDPSVGLVGPATNRSGDESEVTVAYRSWGDYLAEAAARARARSGQALEVQTLTLLCAALRRDVLERVGTLDERFEVGMLEDDDYSERLRAGGYRLLCADDVLVHHFGEGSFGRLVPSGRRDRVLEANKRRFEEKWGRPWRPYRHRENGAYAELVARVRRLATELLPDGATVLVVSRGDEELLRLDGRPAWHFPQVAGGVYAGHYPADSREAISQLEELRERGGQFIVFPESSRWWLDHYGAFRRHLDERYECVARRYGTGVVFALEGGPK